MDWLFPSSKDASSSPPPTKTEASLLVGTRPGLRRFNTAADSLYKPPAVPNYLQPTSVHHGDLWLHLSSENTRSGTDTREHALQRRWSFRSSDRNYHGCVAALLAQGRVSQETLDQIDRDIPRTFPDTSFFTTPAFRTHLRRVLVAAATQFGAIGYVQGMNFVVAFLLVHCDCNEDKAFALFQRLINNPKYQMRGVYGKGLPRLIEFSNTLDLLLQIRDPILHKHFERIGVEPLFYSQNWIMTLFSYNATFDILAQIWDWFFVDGWEVLFRIGLVMLGRLKTTLLNSGFEECAALLRGFDKDLPPTLCREAKLIQFSTAEVDIIESITKPVEQVPIWQQRASSREGHSAAVSASDMTTAGSLTGTAL